MTPDIYLVCRLCRRRAWAHALRDTWLYCDALGGVKSDFTVDELNTLRGILGKRRVTRKGS